MVAKLKSFQTYWNFAHQSIWRYWIWNWNWYLKMLLNLSKLLPKLKSHQIYLNICALVNLKVLLIWKDFEQNPLKSKNYRFSTGIEFFSMTILKKDFILDFCLGPEYSNGSGYYKIIAKWLLKITGKHCDIKGALTQKGLCLVYIFISSFHSVSSVWFFKHEGSFFHFLHYILS